MRRFLTILMVIFITTTLIACDKGGNNADESTSPGITTDNGDSPPVSSPGDGRWMAGYITSARDEGASWFDWNEYQRLAPEFGFEIEVFIVENRSAEGFAFVEQTILDGYDVIFVNHNDIESIVPLLTRAKEAGIIVGMYATDLPPEHQHLRDFLVGVDDYQGTKHAGEFVSAFFPSGARYVEVGGPAGHPAQIKRSEGFQAGISANIIELDSQYCPTGWDPYEARDIMNDFIGKYPGQIDFVYCHWDNGATGVIEALLDSEIYNVLVIGVDGNSTGYSQVMGGVQWLCVGWSVTNVIGQSLHNAKEMMEGRDVPEIDIVSPDLVTIDTIYNLPWPAW